MKKFLAKLVFTFYPLVAAISYYDLTYRYMILSEVYSPCNNLSTLEGPIQGETLFSGSDLSTSSVSEIMITGWFKLKGYYQQ